MHLSKIVKILEIVSGPYSPSSCLLLLFRHSLGERERQKAKHHDRKMSVLKNLVEKMTSFCLLPALSCV